jgi:hypothetical protein
VEQWQRHPMQRHYITLMAGLHAAKLTANKLTANKLTANKLTANKLTANKLTAKKLTANKLTANRRVRPLLQTTSRSARAAMSNGSDIRV